MNLLHRAGDWIESLRRNAEAEEPSQPATQGRNYGIKQGYPPMPKPIPPPPNPPPGPPAETSEEKSPLQLLEEWARVAPGFFHTIPTHEPIEPAKLYAAIKEPHMSFKFSTFITDLEGFFAGFFKEVISSDAGKTLEQGIVSFVKTDIGKLALDAVEYASTLPAGTTQDALRSAAVAKLKEDLSATGKDLVSIGTSTLNLFIEAAFTYAQGTLTAVAAKKAQIEKVVAQA